MPPKLKDGEKTVRVPIHASQSFIVMVDDWRRRQPDIPSRSEAIRRLVEKALKQGN